MSDSTSSSSIGIEFIQGAVQNGDYELSLHADDERIADGLTVEQIEIALSKCELLEDYSDDPRGHSCLVLGFVEDDRPIHAVCGKTRQAKLILITVYIPSEPKWSDPRTRTRKE